MRLSPVRRSSGLHQALIALVIGVLLFSGAPLAAWSAPTPSPTPSPTDTVKRAGRDRREGRQGDPRSRRPDTGRGEDPERRRVGQREALGRTDREGRTAVGRPSDAAEDSESAQRRAERVGVRHPVGDGLAEQERSGRGPDGATVRHGQQRGDHGQGRRQDARPRSATCRGPVWASTPPPLAAPHCLPVPLTSTVIASITVPNTQVGAAPTGTCRYWVRQISAASGYYQNLQPRHRRHGRARHVPLPDRHAASPGHHAARPKTASWSPPAAPTTKRPVASGRTR